MKKIAWLTDLHLEFADTFSQMKALCSELHKVRPDLILVGGDTGLSYSFGDYLEHIADKIQRPVYFVLGNHDCYHGSIRETGLAACQLSKRSNLVTYLTKSGFIGLTDRTALVGHDSWADGRLGSGTQSKLELNDYRLIEEFKHLGPEARFGLLAKMGDQAAEELRIDLVAALEYHKEVIVLTHVPPFREACWHEGRISGDEFLPHFTCKAVGEILVDVASSNPRKSVLVLCGHSHGKGEIEVLPNLVVKTGGAIYGKPLLQEVLLAK